jgi:hypothetical protein
MSAPDRLQRALGDEEPIASTRLGGEDAFVVTPTRSILYRAGGVLSEESVAEFTHDAERIAVKESRRKATITLDYGLEGSDSFTVPIGTLEEVLKSVLAVNLSMTGVVGGEETVEAVFFFDELTLVITDAQVAKHVGAAVWDEDYESIHFEDVTGLVFESGRVNTQVVLESGTTAERIKTPRERARAVREALQDALCQFHGVDSLEALEETLAATAPERESQDSVDAITLGEDFDLLSRDDGGASANATYETAAEDDALDGLYEDRPESDGAPPRPDTATIEVAAGETVSGGATAEGRDGRVHTDAREDTAGSAGVNEPSVGRATRVADETRAGNQSTGEPAQGTGSEEDHDVEAPSETTDEPDAPDSDRAVEATETAGQAQEPENDVDALAAHGEDLAAIVDRQAELLEEQRRTLEALLSTIEERESR